jgi:ABC-type cobalamin/Fe3+-siderophores transport system ATPase subunit
MTKISASGLTLARGGATILSDLSVTLGPRESVAIIGPNGAGKSMLLKAFAGIQTPSVGEVLVDGMNLIQVPRAVRARAIGYLPQTFEPHWDLTIRDLVTLGAERAGTPIKCSVDEALVTFELASLEGRRWSTLSGGERARVLLAMVLVVDPPVLLADEPGASLDVRHRIDLVQTLVQRRTQHLTVVVMHDLDLAFRFFQRVVLIDNGRVVADGLARDLFEDRRLDAVFQVKFIRLETPVGRVLQASY